jgi:ATP-dependent Lon protease
VAAHGLRAEEVVIEDRAVQHIVRGHTREAGVRNLGRELASVLRKVAKRVSEGAREPIVVGPEEIKRFLGPPPYQDEVVERIDRPGIATGLVWTPTGGDIVFVEATVMPGEGDRLVLTGMMGSVMKESAQTALSYLRSNASSFGIDPMSLSRKTVHVHVPAGAIPKDGPSAGVAILVALASLASGRRARSDVASTGEMTLRGRVLPVGGVKDKILAAHRVGLECVILPRRSESQLGDVPDEVRAAMRFVLVDSAEEAVVAALGLDFDVDATGDCVGDRPTEPIPERSRASMH